MSNNPFIVNGETVASQQIDAAIKLMRDKGAFTFMNVGGALYRAGVTWDNHDRAADRLLQRLRKLGQVRFSSGRWTTCKNDLGSI